MQESISVMQLFGLGAVAGVVPVYIGIGAALLILTMVNRSWEGYLTGISTGILVYLFFDLMHESVEQTGARDPLSWLVFLGSLSIGFVGLVVVEQAQTVRMGPEAARLFLPYVVALGMGLHNLGEGLAIGASYARGEWVLSGVLVIGFALHNGTEGFAIIASAGKKLLSNRDLILTGLLAGLPTCIGAVLSGTIESPAFSIASFALAAGSLLYVIFTMVAMFYTATRRMQTAMGVMTGITLMYVTAMVLTLVTGVKS